MTTGDLRDRITLLSKVNSTDGHGGWSEVWAPLTTTPGMWANVTPSGASERVQPEVLTATTSYEVVIRYRADVTPLMRLTWRPYRASADVTLEIHGVTPLDGGRAYLVLACEVVV